VEKVNQLRKKCFEKNVSITVVKNTLLEKALERAADSKLVELIPALKGATALIFTEVGNAPAKIIKEFRGKSDRPILKGAYVEETIYIGDNNLETLANIKSKNELIADVVALLQSPAKRVVSALQNHAEKKDAA
jgi:large subunit ribosomal protein L10